MSNDNYSYSWYQSKKGELSTLMSEASDVINALSMNEFADRLKALSGKVQNESFKVQIVGTFKNGKSTFINALLGEDVLPARVLPCTAVVNELKYGEEKKAILHFVNPLPAKLLDCIPEATLAHMKAHNMVNVPPMEIPYHAIDQYVTIPIDGDPDEIAAASPYLAVEMFYPSPLLEQGVEIIDSPGLNECQERTKCTLSYLDKADAIIYLFDANRACAQDEMEVIEDTLLAKGFNDIFFLVNRIDVVPANQRDDVKKYVEKRVKDYTPNDVYCISGLVGLNGKLKNDEAMIQESGLPPFEERLRLFLTQEKGRVKLAQPARELKNILTKEALFRNIPFQRQQLSTDLGTLQARYDAARPQLEELEIRKEEMHKNMLLNIERCSNEVRRAISQHLRDVARSVPAWIEAYQPQNGVGFGSKRKVDRVANEIMHHVTEQIKKDMAEWNKEVLMPLIQEKAQVIYERSDNDLKDIYTAVDDINAQLSGQSIDVPCASGWERAAGIAAVCLGYPAGAGIAIGGFDMKNLVKSIGLQIGLGAGLVWLGLANPVFAIAAGALLVWQSVSSGKSSALQRLKEKMTDSIVESINNSSTEKSEEIACKVREEFTKIADGATSAVTSEINTVKTQVESILNDLSQGKEHVERKNELLNRSETQLQEICGKLDTLVFELAGLH